LGRERGVPQWGCDDLGPGGPERELFKAVSLWAGERKSRRKEDIEGGTKSTVSDSGDWGKFVEVGNPGGRGKARRSKRT